ncbi:hypothetical protein EFT87_09175 [Schleiferilactobacillus harbinensis]|uniref:hypothetical protein n=1 Tax=Schleiferilactobacillus harbinensis TaxID=304207 RepID=UPI0021A2CA88|nr:hypothetical protein [Schleiferilactobacillus harbinensis]MCT2908823.1 hypothetical protein [Schleiferilactobacillus harbinensis]
MFVYVPYPEDSSGDGKTRPVAVLALSDGEHVLLYTVTTKYETIKKQYAPIKQWQQAGLDHSSWIDVRGVLRVPRKLLEQRRVVWVGRLTAEDMTIWADYIRRRVKRA